jgi:hypothetical protein
MSKNMAYIHHLSRSFSIYEGYKLGVHEPSDGHRGDLWLHVSALQLDHQNSTAALANWLGARLQMDADIPLGAATAIRARA